jgi:Flp pilus assembly protein TadG
MPARRRAAAAAELAFFLPVLVTLVLAAVDFGRFITAYLAVTNAARAGAQYGIMNNFTSSTQSAWLASVQQAARDELANQVDSANVTVPTPTIITDTNNLKRVRVTVRYQFTTLINWRWTGLGLPNSFTMSQSVEMRIIR